MKKFSFKLMFVSLAAMATIACESSSDNGGDDNGLESGRTDLISIYSYTNAGSASGTSTITVKSGEGLYIDQNYELAAPIFVEKGAVLKIAAGVTITHKDNENEVYIMICQGGQILAEGTSSDPIIMTSELGTEGAWGGIQICGYARANIGTSLSEVGDCTYGGDDDTDNSGILRHVIVKYAGQIFTSEKEANGFTFYAVGNNTVVEYCTAYKGGDDGFEWFGGSVNAKYLVSIGNRDDQFDWTEGWRGCAQFLFADHIDNACDQTIEGDNSKSDYDAEPISFPTLANLTLVGDINGSEDSGVLLRNGTKFAIYNALCSGKATDIRISDVDSDKSASYTGTYPTSSSLESSESVFKNVYTNTFKNDDDSSIYVFTTDNTVNGSSKTYTSSSTETADACGLGTINGFTFDAAHYAGSGNTWMSQAMRNLLVE